MEIAEFDNMRFSGKTIVEYRGVNYNVESVDFVEKLIGIDIFKDEEYGLSWVRCENVKLVSNAD